MGASGKGRGAVRCAGLVMTDGSAVVVCGARAVSQGGVYSHDDGRRCSMIVQVLAVSQGRTWLSPCSLAKGLEQ